MTPDIPTVRKVHPASIVLFTVSVALLCISGVMLASGRGSPGTTASPSPVVVYSYLTAPAAVTTAPPTSPPPPAAPTVQDGTWTVGLDFPAGKYRATAVVDPDCYWAITKSGTNGEEIIANDIPGGGRPTVTLKAGQDFQSQRCGTWAKVG